MSSCARGSSGLPAETRVVYVSPLKALSNDIQRNLAAPLQGIRAELSARGLPELEIQTLVRTGDTPAQERARMRRSPPHIVVTTPESLYILLGSESGRRALATTRTVIVDEIHALAGNKRGAHLALSLERLAALTGRPLTRIGLSATQEPVAEVARFLLGAPAFADPAASCTIIDAGHRRARDLALELPGAPLEAVMSGEVWIQLYDRLAELVRAHRTTLVFVNTRRLAERLARHLSERLGNEHVMAHHGSLAKERRHHAEQRLKRGDLKVLVATASLSSASTSATWTSCVSCPRRIRSMPSCSVSVARDMQSAASARGGSSHSRATISSSARPCCWPWGQGSSIISRSPRTARRALAADRRRGGRRRVRRG